MKPIHAHTPQTSSRRRWTAALAAYACLALLPLGLHANELTAFQVPTAIAVPAGNKPFLRGYAIGTQNYMCLPQGSGVTWKPIGPQATLFNDDMQQIISHFLSLNPHEEATARPTWQHSRDSSAAWAMPIASSTDSTFVAPGAVPWLLLEVVGTAPNPPASGKLTATTYIQRIHTTGGVPPTTGCTTAMNIGARAFIEYNADYIFYKAKDHH